MESSKIVISVGVPLGGSSISRVRISEEKGLNMKFPRKIESV